MCDMGFLSKVSIKKKSLNMKHMHSVEKVDAKSHENERKDIYITGCVWTFSL